MPPKRKRGETKLSKAASAAVVGSAKSKHDDEEEEEEMMTDILKSSSMALLLENMKHLSTDKTRCTETLSALTDGRCLGETTKKEDHADCYWILLSTHVINRMIQVLDKNPSEDSESISVLLASLCHSLATILLSDKAKLERSANAATASHSAAKFVRSILGRAIVSVTIGSTLALEQLVGTLPHKIDLVLIRKALWSALFALDMVVHWNIVKPTVSADGWHHALNSLLEDTATLELDALKSTIHIASNALQISKEEDSLIQSLADVNGLPEVEEGKREGRRSSATKKSSVLADAFALMAESSPANSTAIDGRISVRRWASMAFVWLCQGQSRGMDAVVSLLENEEAWSTILDCPSTLIEMETPTKKRGGKGKRKTPGVKIVELIRVPGAVAVTTLAARFLDLICVSGSNGGARSPTGGMDTYVAAIVSGLETRKKGSKQLQGFRWDLRNVSTVVVYNLIQVHAKCIRENVKVGTQSNNERRRMLILNDETTGPFSPVPLDGEIRAIGDAIYYPFVHKTLDALCRLTPASFGGSFSQEAIDDSTKKLLVIASSYILGCTCDRENIRIVDLKLYNFAISQLGNSLRVLFEDDEDMGDDVDDSEQVNYDVMSKSFTTLQPLPVPIISKATTARKKKGPDGVDDCTFAGIFETKFHQSDFTLEEDLFKLFIRAFVKEGPCVDILPSIFYDDMLELIRCCYDTRKKTNLDVEDSLLASSLTPQGNFKRRKIMEQKVKSGDNPDKVVSVRGYRRLNSLRAGLASDVWNVLQLCLTLQFTTRPELQLYLRESFTTHQMCTVVELSRMLDCIMATARKDGKSSDAYQHYQGIAFSDSGNFNLFERSLWSAHINCCMTLSRGQVSFDPTSHNSTRPILGSAEKRLALFKEIAKSTGIPDGRERWPLCLTGTQHAIVSSNLSSEPIYTEIQDSSRPDRFIADSMIASIAYALKNPTVVSNASWYNRDDVAEETSNRSNGEETAAEAFPLSQKDGRLLLMAVSRIPRNDQITCLAVFVDVLATALSEIRSSNVIQKIVFENPEVSAFVARSVNICATLVTLVDVGPSLRETLFAQVGPTLYHLPFLVSKKDALEAFSAHDQSWYKRESCFMGVFADWESPIIPDVATPISSNKLSQASLSQFEEVLEIAFSLGLDAARNDKGLLLFTAWNASGRRPLWDPNWETQPYFHAKEVKEIVNPKFFLQLREDICMVHRRVHGNEGGFPDSMLATTLDKRDQFHLETPPLIEVLASMMKKAETVLDALLQGLRDDACGELHSLLLFSILEALSVYISFIISMHTKAGDSFLKAAALRAKRKPRHRLRSGDDVDTLASILSEEEDSGRSEVDYDYEESQEEEKINALAKLHEACNAFGSAPIHPDWLDESCRYREGITNATALCHAESALRCLNKLSRFALSRYEEALNCVLGSFAKDLTDLEARTNLATLLCLQSQEESNLMNIWMDEDQEDGGLFESSVASIVRLDEAAIRFLLHDVECRNRRSAKEAWCPNSVQHIHGLVQDRSVLIEGWEACHSEYRAGGEWELLLSETLLGACLDTTVGNSDDNIANFISEQPQTYRNANIAYTTAERWRKVFESSVSHLAPATALLRFGMSSGIGRKPHPFSGGKVTDNAKDIRIIETLPFEPLETLLSESGKSHVFEALRLLPKISRWNRGDTRLKRACFAAAANLLVDTDSFGHLEAMNDVAFIFSLLPELAKDLNTSRVVRDTPQALQYLLDKLIILLESCGLAPLSPDRYAPSTSTLVAYLRDDALLKIDTVVLASVPCRQLIVDKALGDAFFQRQELEQLVYILCAQQFETSHELRWRLTSVLCSIAELDYALHTSKPPSENNSLVDQLANALALEGKTSVQLLVRTSLLDQHDCEGNKFLGDLVAPLCRFLSLLACSSSFREPAATGIHSTASWILDVLMEGIETKTLYSLGSSECAPLTLAFLLGTCDSQLQKIGNALFALSQSKSGTWNSESELQMSPLEFFFKFVCDLRKSVSTQSLGSPKIEFPISNVDDGQTIVPPTSRIQMKKVDDDTTSHSILSNPLSAAPRACSFVLKSGFHAQHWYNCYTCGLVWDKGCCTLCALTCHRDHEVTYSRHSSFFCDCGAEVASAVDENRVTCKCINPVTSEDASELLECDLAKSFLVEHKFASLTVPSFSQTDPPANCTRLVSPVDIAAIAFPANAAAALNILRDEAIKSKWTSSFFRLVGSLIFLEEHDDRTTVIKLGQGFGNEEEKNVHPREAMASKLRNRQGKVLSVEQIHGKGLVPIRAARSGAFNVKLSSDTGTDRVKRAILSKNGVNRTILVSDYRGRLILAEPCSLLFCSALPTANTKYVPEAVESLSARSQMSILGSATVKFQIVGTKLCDENQRHLVVWGVSEATVAILGPRCDSVVRWIDLNIDLDRNDSEADHVIKCEWIPGSQSSVAVVCGMAIKVFDIRQTENDRAVPSVNYTLAQDAFVRDVALVPHQKYPSRTDSKAGFEIKLYVLLDTGRLHAVEMRFDANGEIEDNVSLCLESGDCVSLPTGGVRSCQGLDPSSAGATSKSLGEGSSLNFLAQSRLLLYKCITSCVLALIVDDKGNVSGSFEFLPNVIPSDNLGLGSESYYMTGPYTLWTEFGTVRKEAFRVLCVAKSSRSNQPRLLCIEFNYQYTRIKPFTWSVTSSMGLGLSLCSSFEGLAVFSAPVSCDDGSFGERAFASIVTSSGAMLTYGEDQEEYDSSCMMAEFKTAKMSPSITIFEKLVDVSDYDDLIFGGDAVGSDPDGAKMKLSVKNNIYLLSPSREGCTLTVCLTNSSKKTGNKKAASSSKKEATVTERETPPSSFKEDLDQGDLVIVALRILVGSTSQDCIPRQLLIEGRPHQLTADLKRWYDLPFTREDILLGLRNGFVTIGVSSSFSGTNPMIDAIQVYAIDRNTIASWVPTICVQPTFPSSPRELTATPTESRYIPLVQSLSSLTHLYHILNSEWKKNADEGLILKRLIRGVAVDGDQKLKDTLHSFLQEIMPNENDKQLFLDEETLSGVTKNLKLAIENLDKGLDVDDDTFQAMLMQAIGGSLKASIDTAERRPRNYAVSTEKLICEGVSNVSIATQASQVLGEALQHDLGHLVVIDDVVKLALLEIGICNSLPGVEKKLFASFPLIGALLLSSNASVVQKCCNAIAGFVESKEKKHIPSPIDQISDFAGAHPIAYQCDSCSKFPITDSRFTLPDGDNYDIDLCTNCFRAADQYALRHLYDSSHVVVNGKTIGEEAKLTCRQVHLMCPVPIINGPLVEQAVKEVKTAVAQGNSMCKESIDEDSSLKKALSRQETVNESVNFSPLLDRLFLDILELTSSALSLIRMSQYVSGTKANPLLLLLLRFIKTSKNEEIHTARAKHFAEVVTKHTSALLGDMPHSKTNLHKKLQLINCLRSLSQLLPNREGTDASAPIQPLPPAKSSTSKSKDKTDPRFVCEEHRIPAVRRRCSRGISKNRRFYVCGADRKQRCKYFRWADEGDEEVEPSRPQTDFSKKMESIIWKLMEEPYGESKIPLSAQLCNLLESELISHGGLIDSILPTEIQSNGPQSKLVTKSTSLLSTYDNKTAILELNDGVNCSREKISGMSSDFLTLHNAHAEPIRTLLDESEGKDLAEKVVEATLDLVSTVADTVVKGSSLDYSNTQARWFSLLCEIISLSASEYFRSQAKQALKRLCGSGRALYHSVRDHYVFGFQFGKLLQNSSELLHAALDVREQAKQCGPCWSVEPYSWKSMNAGSLIGTLDLISEDALSIHRYKRIGEVLDELTRSQGANWRQFCGLTSLPRKERNLHCDSKDNSTPTQPEENCFSDIPPIISLMWLACSLQGPNQAKTLKLIDYALTHENKYVPSESLPDGLDLADDSIDAQSVDSSLAVYASELVLPEKNPLESGIKTAAPEEILLSPEIGLSVDGLHAFIIHFVLRGRSQESRKVASQVATKLCQSLSQECLGNLSMSLVSYPLTEIRSLGSASIQHLQLLQTLLGLAASSIDAPKLKEVARKITQCFCEQIQMLRDNGRGRKVYTLEASGQGRESFRKRFDLSKCAHCSRVKPTVKAPKSSPSQQRATQSKRASSSRSRLPSRGNTPTGASVVSSPQWLTEQVRPFIKSRLDLSTNASVSDEFNLFVQLKCRLAVSDIHLAINDPRGRFVKTIAIYFTPRQVRDAVELKTEDYSSFWQPCGTLSLTRGATRISYTLPDPVVAANLRFEYKDFYDRPGGSRAADGSPILHCPRCTRVVNNTHGVCGHCGEVAFQCRKCRHINYDRFDSFLCVECSYCSSGTFGYEITAGVASNAVAIVDDESYSRSVKILKVATNLHGDLKRALEEKSQTVDMKRPRTVIPEYFDELGPTLKRALIGELPSDGDIGDGQGGACMSLPTRFSEEVPHQSSAATRARSLLRLARSLRNDTDRSSSRELLLREAFLAGSAGRELSLEDFDDPDGDLAGFVNIERFGSDADPLSRLVASIQGRRESTEAPLDSNGRTNNLNQSNQPGILNTGAASSPKTLVEECEKLYNLMRESERECFEVSRRINAWQRLEHDALAEVSHPIKLKAEFTPSQCTKCCGPITLHLLILVMRLFSDIPKVPLTKEFVQALFLESSNMNKDLLELKRLAITTLASKSEVGAMFVLAELQRRMKASSDGMASQILGKLLAEGDFPLADQFVTLATQTLEG